MSTLRPSLRDEILRELDNTSFGKDLFDLKFHEDGFLICVNFIPNENFSFKTKEIENSRNPREQYLSLESPGQFTLEAEEFKHETFGNSRNRILSWAHRIEADIKASNPIDSSYDEIRDQILSQFKQYESDGNIHFTKEEKDTIHESLNELKSKMEALYKEKDATQHQLNLMKQQITKLTESIEILDKRTWVLAAANRVINIFKEVKAAVGEVKTITNDISKLIPQNTDESD